LTTLKEPTQLAEILFLSSPNDNHFLNCMQSLPYTAVLLPIAPVARHPWLTGKALGDMIQIIA
jgi:hypothetical protein